MSYGRIRYRLHRVLPMRLIDRVEEWLRHVYWREGSEWSKRWLDRLAWFTTPYEGARMSSSLIDGINQTADIQYYKLMRWDTTNVRWEMMRTYGPTRYRMIGLTGGTHGR